MSCTLKAYRNLFGQPRTGAHSYRIFNLAIVDIVSTIIAAYVIHLVFRSTFGKTLLVLFLLGIVLHRVFCVRTTIDRLLFKCDNLST